MRLSEKTLELNICSQVSRYAAPKHRLLWFGLTQRQEARAGFDACIKLRGRLLIFQFKASNRVLKSGERLFLAHHRQLVALRARSGAHQRSVFYAFPLVGTTAELHKNPDLLSQTWLLDVAGLPLIGPPTTGRGVLRRNECHNVYVQPGRALIHSDPIATDLVQFKQLVSSGFPGADGITSVFEERFAPFWDFSRAFTKGARALVLW